MERQDSHFTGRRPELTVIVPVFNEERNIPAIVERLHAVLSGCVSSHELLFVDDGSRDGSREVLRGLALADSRVRFLAFSRNFGKEIAIAAGIEAAAGDAAVIIDADLQHPPETIPLFVAKWREDFDMVYGIRTDRETDGRLYTRLARRFYRTFEQMGEMPLPEGAGDFRLISRRIMDALKAMPERARFSKGLFAWVGFPQASVEYKVAPRLHGSTKWNYGKLLRFALDGLTSFSTVPLKLATFAGLTISMLAFLYAIVQAVRTLVFGTDVPGFPTLVVAVMFFSGIQLVFLGVLGEYIGRIYDEVKQRPLYLLAEDSRNTVAPKTKSQRKTRAKVGSA